MAAYVIWEAIIPDASKLDLYAEKVGATIEAFGGRRLAVGGRLDVREGDLNGTNARIILEFADMKTAQHWYESDLYQEILPLRTDHASGTFLIVDGL